MFYDLSVWFNIMFVDQKPHYKHFRITFCLKYFTHKTSLKYFQTFSSLILSAALLYGNNIHVHVYACICIVFVDLGIFI